MDSLHIHSSKQISKSSLLIYTIPELSSAVPSLANQHKLSIPKQLNRETDFLNIAGRNIPDLSCAASLLIAHLSYGNSHTWERIT